MSEPTHGRSKFRFILYDLDGTLVNSVPYGIDLFQATAKRLSLHTPPADSLRRWWGYSTREIVHAFWPHIPQEQFSNVLREIALSTKAFEVIPGATEAVRHLRTVGKLDGIFTNRRRGDGLGTILASIGLPHDTWTILCSPEDMGSSKSDPLMLQKLLATLADRHGIGTHEILFIGDTVLDAMIASINGVSFVGVMTGAATRDDFCEEGVPENHILPSIAHVVPWLDLA